MSWNKRIRSLHRLLSAIFVLLVLANLAVMAVGNEQLGMAVGGLTLIPLVLLIVTGVYLFVLPYTRRTSKESQISR